MFSKIFQKAALFGASTVAGVALAGTVMVNSAEAATMSYRSEFSVTSNSLSSDVVTGDFSFTKTDLNNGFFSYKLEDFNVSVGAFGFNESLNLDDVKANPNPFIALNEAFVPDKYRGILPSVLDEEDSNYEGDGDFPPEDFSFTFGLESEGDSDIDFGNLGNNNFPADNFHLVFREEDFGNIAASLSGIIDVDTGFATILAGIAFGQGGEVSFTTKAVPEPTTIFGIGMVGVGLTATRRRRASKKIKEKAAA